MAVAELADATVAVALNNRAIDAESARLPRFTYDLAAGDYRVTVLGRNSPLPVKRPCSQIGAGTGKPPG
jgi:hypothetical protein